MKSIKIIAAALIIACTSTVFSQPNWKRINHISSTIFTAIVTVDGKPAPASAYVGAFVGDECRMVSPLIVSNDSTYVSAVIHGDKPETIQFKMWINESDIRVSKKSLTTKPGESILLEKIDF